MPMYEYHCLECHHEFQRLRASDDRDAALTCPACGGTRARRALSVFATMRGTSTSGATATEERPSGGGCACGGNCGCH